ncbi:MAG: type I 3-dehydroquinate dehydratase [Lachnospiraceae bacterium]|nr:type I 3-dehydroquinate dehydratase [Lachnospiraceae bacterium]
MKPVVVRGLEIGVGMPKICVSIMGKTKAEIIEETKIALATDADLLEWRVDFCELNHATDLIDILGILREMLHERPLLFTLRTLREGGCKEIAPLQYVQILQRAIESRCVDIVDVEIFVDVYDSWKTVKELDIVPRNNMHQYTNTIIAQAHKHNVKVLGSNHNFKGTSPMEEIVLRLLEMKNIGVDIGKIAVMPKSKKDVLTLLNATLEMSHRGMNIPIVTMAMGDYGKISRICGEFFGSAVTFAAVREESAPGQIKVDVLKEMLAQMHVVL